MARKPKNKWIGVRVDAELEADVNSYIENADMTTGQLVRAALKEFMWAHPKGGKQPIIPPQPKPEPEPTNAKE